MYAISRLKVKLTTRGILHTWFVLPMAPRWDLLYLSLHVWYMSDVPCKGLLPCVSCCWEFSVLSCIAHARKGLLPPVGVFITGWSIILVAVGHFWEFSIDMYPLLWTHTVAFFRQSSHYYLELRKVNTFFCLIRDFDKLLSSRENRENTSSLHV